MLFNETIRHEIQIKTFDSLEGASKAQIITPRSITPTNENAFKKKKTEDSRKLLTNQKNQAKPDPKATTSNKVIKDPSPPPKPVQQSKNG